MARPVHMVGFSPTRLLLDQQVTTRCGVVCVTVAREQPFYTVLSDRGGKFQATTRGDLATCMKCRSLIDTGSIHARKQ